MIRLVPFILAILAAFGCQATTRGEEGEKKKASDKGPKLGEGVKPADEAEPFVHFAGTPSLPANLALTAPVTPSAELEALAHCDACPRRRAAWLTRLNTSPGALPEALVPSVREKIKVKPELARIQALPNFLGDALLDNFASDEKITEEIRAGVAERLGGGATRFSFEGFLRLEGEAEGEVRLDAQAARWRFVFADAAKSGGTQNVETLRALMEWSYLAGLEAPYGGMSRDLDNGAGLAGAYDPRKQTKAKRFFGGTMRVELPAISARHRLLGMALQGGERWSLTSTELPPLAEAARLWAAAAAAFQKLREDRMESAVGKLVPADAKSLPLVFLKTMSTLLPREYLDLKTHSLPKASLEDLVLLAEALTAWARALKNIDKAGLDPETTLDLEGARGSLQDALRATISQLISKHVTAGPSAGLVVDEPRLTGRTLTALADAEHEILSSPHLRSIVQGLVHGVAARGVTKTMDASEALWLARGLTATQGLVAAPWTEDLVKTLQDAVERWDGAE